MNQEDDPKEDATKTGLDDSFHPASSSIRHAWDYQDSLPVSGDQLGHRQRVHDCLQLGETGHGSEPTGPPPAHVAGQTVVAAALQKGRGLVRMALKCRKGHRQSSFSRATPAGGTARLS